MVANLSQFQYVTPLRIYASVNWVSIGSGNGLSAVQCQAITWTNADLLSMGRLGTNFSETQIKIFCFMKVHFKMLSVKWQPFSPRGDELSVPLHMFLHISLFAGEMFDWDMMVSITTINIKFLLVIPPWISIVFMKQNNVFIRWNLRFHYQCSI